MVIVGGRGTGILTTVMQQQLGEVYPCPAGLNGVHVFAEDRAFVVGERGYAASMDINDGSIVEWPSITLDVLHATFVDSTGLVYAVGGNLFTADQYFHGIIMRTQVE